MCSESIYDFFRSHKYFVSVYPDIDANACLVEYPQRPCVKPVFDGLTSVYAFEELNEAYETSGLSYVSTSFPSHSSDEIQTLETNIFIPCPRYAARTLVYYDIYYKTKKIKLSPEIIFLLNEKGLGETPFSLYNIFKPALSKEEGWKESKLAGFMFLKIEDEETDLASGAIEEDVLEGYRLLDTIPL